MFMRKIFLVAMLLTTMIFTGCGGNTSDKGGAESAQDRKIVIGLDEEYPPMGFKNEKNEIIGFDIDLAKAVAKKLGREVEFKAIDWIGKEAELKSGRIDVLWNGLDITPERRKTMLFSDPYMDNRQIVFIRKGDYQNSNIAAETDLAEKAVGTQAGSTAAAYITGNEALKHSFKDFKTYRDYISAFSDLENGRIEVVVCDEIVGRYYMAKHPDKIDAVNVLVGPTSKFAVAFAKENTALRDEVQKAFDEIVADGTAKKISEEWFGENLIRVSK